MSLLNPPPSICSPDDACRLRAVPTELLTGCSSLATLTLHGNPLTAEQLRDTPGWAAFDERRKAKYDKQVGWGEGAAALSLPLPLPSATVSSVTVAEHSPPSTSLPPILARRWA